MAQAKNSVQGITDHSNFLSGPIPYIPIDFIKGELINIDVVDLLNNSLLEFTRPVNEDTGVLLTSENIKGKIKQIPRKAQYKNLTFKIYESGLILIHGSIHKYFNEGLHNFNDFTHENYLTALKQLKIDFGIKPKNIRIQTLEYGINITPPIYTNTILKYSFVHSRTKLTEPISYLTGRYKQAHYQKFVFKLYNKKLQYEKGFTIETEILRIEIKQTNWTEYRAKGIFTLADFNNFDKVLFVKDLIKQWERVIYYNPENVCKDSEYRNSLFWLEFKNKSSLYSYHKKRLREINPADYDIQKHVCKIIADKIKELQ